jgi:hypothetical protein
MVTRDKYCDITAEKFGTVKPEEAVASQRPDPRRMILAQQ